MNNNIKQKQRQSIVKYLLQIQRYIEPVELGMAIGQKAQEVRSLLLELERAGEVINIKDEYIHINTRVETQAVENTELSDREKEEFEYLKKSAKRAFYVFGLALSRIRDFRLYREEYSTFEEFCQSEFGFSRQYVNYQINGAKIFENLKMTTNGCQNKIKPEIRTDGSQNRTKVLPTPERQVRPLAKLQPEKQAEVWQKACDRSNGKVPSAKLVQQIAKENASDKSPGFEQNSDAFLHLAENAGGGASCR